MQKDSVLGTLLVATGLCVVCSVLVSTAAVSLKSRQVENKKLDIKKNILLASGLLQNNKASKEQIEEAYKSIKAEVVSLSTGEVITDLTAEEFDQRSASKDPKSSTLIPKDKDVAGLKKRATQSIVYKVMKESNVEMLIFPVHGKGLWSTMYGFIALSNDLQTIKGIGFYEHGETPGLGGEIDNPRWKAQWSGKKAFNEELQPIFEVVKGSVNPADTAIAYKVDGLSGATITSNGVTGLVRYWLGEHGFGPFLQKYSLSLKESISE